MAGFADRLQVRLLDAAEVRGVLVPAGDTARSRLRALLTSVYEPETLSFETVDDVAVEGLTPQVPVATGRTGRATWERVTPAVERSLLSWETPPREPADWIDLAAQTTVTVRVGDRSGPLESVTGRKVTVPAGADHAHGYRLHYREPDPFDPTDPTLVRTYPLRICALFCPEPDLVGALRRVVAARRAVDAARLFRDSHEGGPVRSAAAWLAVFDAATVATPERGGVARLFAAADAVAAFETA
jgi:hypothetical protein